jgi:hypothetical protein
MKSRTLIIIAVIVIIILIASYWHSTEQYSNAGADSKLNLYMPKPTPQIAGKGYLTCDGVVMM